jgi:hypothetical protein
MRRVATYCSAGRAGRPHPRHPAARLRKPVEATNCVNPQARKWSWGSFCGGRLALTELLPDVVARPEAGALPSGDSVFLNVMVSPLRSRYRICDIAIV